MQEPSHAPERQQRGLIAEQCRSKLILAALRDYSGPINPDHLRRVREPVSRSKSGVQGKVADIAGGRSRHAESQNELKAFQVLIATARSDAWQEQPFSLEYHLDGTKHRYTPDVLVAWGAHQEVVEIKEDSEADSPENRTRASLSNVEKIGDLRRTAPGQCRPHPALSIRPGSGPGAGNSPANVFLNAAVLSASVQGSRGANSKRTPTRAGWKTAHRLVGADWP